MPSTKPFQLLRKLLPEGAEFVSGWRYTRKTGTWSRCVVYKALPGFHGECLVLGPGYTQKELSRADIAWTRTNELVKSRNGDF